MVYGFVPIIILFTLFTFTLCSGTRPARRDSGPSSPLFTETLTASSSCMTSPTRWVIRIKACIKIYTVSFSTHYLTVRRTLTHRYKFIFVIYFTYLFKFTVNQYFTWFKATHRWLNSSNVYILWQPLSMFTGVFPCRGALAVWSWQIRTRHCL